MRNEMTVAELKALLERFDDNDVLHLWANECGAGVELWKEDSLDFEPVLEKEV